MKNSTEEMICRYVKKHGAGDEAERDIRAAISLLERTFRNGGKLLICGNGGSCADAGHITAELVKSFRICRPLDSGMRHRLESECPPLAEKLEGGLPAIDLGAQNALITAMLNDVGADYIYAQQVISYGRPGDVLLGISTSGNSKNILYAAAAAKAKGMRTIGLTGRSGGAMRPRFDMLLCVDEDVTEDIQDAHSALYHLICAALENEFWGE